jgi:hypothetical protein
MFAVPGKAYKSEVSAITTNLLRQINIFLTFSTIFFESFDNFNFSELE